MTRGDDRLRARLKEAEDRGLLRALVEVSGPGVRVRVDGRPVISFCSNDYLGFSTAPSVVEGARRALDRYGAGAGSSRLIAGDSPLVRAVEERLAAFVGREAALIFGAGYLANMGIIQSLAGPGDRLLSDALNHASLIDGCRLSRAQVRILPHGDLDALRGALKEQRSGEGAQDIVLTESLFGMDGDRPDLKALTEVTQAAGALTIVDEAHAIGVEGEGGRGLSRGLPVDAVIGTFGKALGSCGAFVAGSATLRTYLINRARAFVFTTAPAPAALGAVAGALDLLERDPEPLGRLRENTAYLHRRLRALGFDTRPSESHILPILIGAPAGALALSEALLEAGYFVRAIRPPTVPVGTSRLRLTVSADHTRGDLDGLADALEVHARALALGPFGEAR